MPFPIIIVVFLRVTLSSGLPGALDHLVSAILYVTTKSTRRWGGGRRQNRYRRWGEKKSKYIKKRTEKKKKPNLPVREYASRARVRFVTPSSRVRAVQRERLNRIVANLYPPVAFGYFCGKGTTVTPVPIIRIKVD